MLVKFDFLDFVCLDLFRFHRDTTRERERERLEKEKKKERKNEKERKREILP